MPLSLSESSIIRARHCLWIHNFLYEKQKTRENYVTMNILTNENPKNTRRWFSFSVGFLQMTIWLKTAKAWFRLTSHVMKRVLYCRRSSSIPAWNHQIGRTCTESCSSIRKCKKEFLGVFDDILKRINIFFSGKAVLNQKTELQRALEKQKERHVIAAQNEMNKDCPSIHGELGKVIMERAQKNKIKDEQNTCNATEFNEEYLKARAKLRGCNKYTWYD